MTGEGRRRRRPSAYSGRYSAGRKIVLLRERRDVRAAQCRASRTAGAAPSTSPSAWRRATESSKTLSVHGLWPAFVELVIIKLHNEHVVGPEREPQ